MLQVVTNNVSDGHPDSEARTAIEVCHLYGLLASLFRAEPTHEEKLAVEFTALFLGPGGHISPHESVQADPDGGSLWGDETLAVKHFIEGLDLAFTEEYTGLPDHISVELDLMANLAGHEAQGWEQNDLTRAANALAYQQDFMQEHLLRWVPLFCKKIIETADLAFYRGVARMTRDFLASEAEDIKRRLELAGPPPTPTS